MIDPRRQLRRVARSVTNNSCGGCRQSALNPNVKMAESTVNLRAESICTCAPTWNRTKNDIARLGELNYFFLWTLRSSCNYWPKWCSIVAGAQSFWTPNVSAQAKHKFVVLIIQIIAKLEELNSSVPGERAYMVQYCVLPTLCSTVVRVEQLPILRGILRNTAWICADNPCGHLQKQLGFQCHTL